MGLLDKHTSDNSALNAIVQLLGTLSAAGLATETTLLGVLSAVEDHQDFEIKLVRDTGDSDIVVLQRIEYDETAGTYSYSYFKADGSAHTAVGPLEYLDASAVLNLVLAELQTLNTVDFATETTLATLLTETTFTSTDFATETTLASLLTEATFSGTDFATETTLATLLTEATFSATDFATETTLDAVKTAVESIDTNLSGVARTVAFNRITDTTGSPVAGAREITVFNAGAADGDIWGGSGNIKPGEAFTFTAGGENDTLPSFAYDATGTELVITVIS
jgi:sulfur carrier protein ThiS